jgi:hypothetical protein
MIISSIRRYFSRVGTAVSILFNVLIGGKSNQTFSARNYEWGRQGKPNITRFIDVLFNDDTHCMTSWTFWVTTKLKDLDIFFDISDTCVNETKRKDIH